MLLSYAYRKRLIISTFVNELKEETKKKKIESSVSLIQI